MDRLTNEQIETVLTELDGWHRKDEKWIERKYRFQQFMDGIGFVNKVAEISERMNHHPMIAIDYKLITLRLSTWSAGGLTDLDTQMAAEINELYQTLSPS